MLTFKSSELVAITCKLNVASKINPIQYLFIFIFNTKSEYKITIKKNVIIYRILTLKNAKVGENLRETIYLSISLNLVRNGKILMRFFYRKFYHYFFIIL